MKKEGINTNLQLYNTLKRRQAASLSISRSGLVLPIVPFRQPYFLFFQCSFFGLRQGFGIIRMCFSLQKQHISYHPNGAKTSSPVLSFYFWTIETQEVNGVFFWCKQFFYPSAISSFSEFVFSPRPSGISEAWDGLCSVSRENVRNRRVSYTAPKRNTKKLIYITFFLEIHVSLNSS
jgi:hypothetical protein